MRAILLAAAVFAAIAGPASAQSVKLSPAEGDYVIKNFKFKTGESLPELRLHYTTLGAPHRNAKGQVDNAVYIMHGTGGWGGNFFNPVFADVLFAPGGLLDPAKYFIILPDGIGHGKSSKPSDGLHMKFPKYDYDDMVAADFEMVTKGLKVDHLRLVMGTSMGCMHSFVWGETYPDFMDALMPLACLPAEIAGRNRVWRRMIMDAITSDPDWQGGEYKTEPMRALRTAESIQTIAGSAPLNWQERFPTRAAADAYADKAVPDAMASVDANDILYFFDASRNYDPSKGLSKIKAPVIWVNSTDDFINPPELGLAEGYVKQIKHGRFVLVQATKETHGHGTHTMAAIWKDKLAELLKESARKD